MKYADVKYAESLAERMALETAALTGAKVNVPRKESEEPVKMPEQSDPETKQ